MQLYEELKKVNIFSITRKRKQPNSAQPTGTVDSPD